MAEPKRITTPLTEEQVAGLRAGDQVLITGTMLTARDAAHKRMYELLQAGQPLPFDPAGKIIYYVGPTPPKPGQAIGSAGPTTSGRVDKYTPAVLQSGVKGLVGKGYRNQDVKDAIVKHKAVYMVSVGGAGALLAKRITASELVCWDDLGTEAVRALQVVDFPVFVIHDMYGGDLYADGQKQWRRQEAVQK